MAVKQTFADRLKKWRGARTQKEAAFDLQVDIDVYRKWEQGRNEPHESPSLGEVKKRMAGVK